MKIMFVMPSLGNGGAERVVSVLANAFEEAHNEVDIMLLANNQIYYPISSSIKIICLDKEWKTAHDKISRIAKRIKLIKQYVKQEKPDIVISFMAETNIDVSIALMKCSIPFIISERNDPSKDPHGILKKILRYIVYSRPNGFVFQTEEAQKYFSKAIQKKSTIILNPLVSKLPKHFEGEREKRIVTVARLDKQKNFPLLLDAFADFHKIKPEYQLEIYGEGPQEAEIKQMVEDKKLSEYVRFMGFCKDVHERINNASMFVMTSDYEGLPNALIEAMALGLPCVSTDCPCGGPKMLIKDKKNGYLVKIGDREGILQAMINIIDNNANNKIGKEAIKIQHKVDLQTVTNQWLDYINKIKG